MVKHFQKFSIISDIVRYLVSFQYEVVSNFGRTNVALSRRATSIPSHPCKENKTGIENYIIKLFFEFGMIIATRDSIKVFF